MLTASSASGRACVKRLLFADDVHVRACFRSEAKKVACVPSLLEEAGWSSTTADASHLDSLVNIDAGDVASLRGALKGADAAVVVTPLDYARGFGMDAEYSINMCRAAIQEDVERIVHIGSWTTVAPKALPGLSQRFLTTEEFLRDSEEIPRELEWCVLRGGYFLSNLAHIFGEGLRRGDTKLTFPPVVMPPVDVRDIGAVAAELCLLQSGAGNPGFGAFQRRFVQCSGPAMLNFTSLTRALGDAIGRKLTHEPIDVEAWCEGQPLPLQELLRHMVEHQHLAVPFDRKDVDDMETLLGRPLRGVTEWARDHAHLFVKA